MKSTLGYPIKIGCIFEFPHGIAKIVDITIHTDPIETKLHFIFTKHNGNTYEQMIEVNELVSVIKNRKAKLKWENK